MASKASQFLDDLNFRGNGIAMNAPPMNWGEVGEPVRVVQQALIELGFGMPDSTKFWGSPNGIFGDEMKDRVQAFQARHHLQADGIVGGNTLAELDHQLNQVRHGKAPPKLPPLPGGMGPFLTHRFRVVFRCLSSEPDPIDLRGTKSCLESVYNQYGFQVDEGPGMTLALNKHQRNKIFVLEMFHDDPEHTLERLKRLGNAQWFNSTDIFIYIVNLRGFEEEDEDIDYQRKYNACALGHWANVAAVGQTAEVDRLTAAHEVGHILFEPHHLPNKGHSQSRVNLMYAEGPKMTQVANLNVPGLTESQVRMMQSSKCCTCL